MNEGIEHHFYVPAEYWDEWNRIIQANRLNRFQMRSMGVENAVKKHSGHWNIQANLRAEAEGLSGRENMLLSPQR